MKSKSWSSTETDFEFVLFVAIWCELLLAINVCKSFIPQKAINVKFRLLHLIKNLKIF